MEKFLYVAFYFEAEAYSGYYIVDVAFSCEACGYYVYSVSEDNFSSKMNYKIVYLELFYQRMCKKASQLNYKMAWIIIQF